MAFNQPDAPRTGPSVVQRPWRVRVAVAIVGLALIAAACGDSEPEVTMAERLADVEGRELTETELNDRLAVGATLCGMSDGVLDALWRTLNERQLNFQDVVFGHICPERSVFYAGLTGRYVTQEAEDSGVVTSTTRPPLTTVAPATTEDTSPTVSVSPDTTAAGSTDPDAPDNPGTESEGSEETDSTADGDGEPEGEGDGAVDGESSDESTTVPSTTVPPTTVLPTSSEPADGEGG